MTDRQPRPGLCVTCHLEARAPESHRCPACRSAWEHRAAAGQHKPSNALDSFTTEGTTHT